MRRVCGQAKSETENCFRDTVSYDSSEERTPLFFIWCISSPHCQPLMTSPHQFRFNVYFKGWDISICRQKACACTENKQYFQVKKSSLGLEFIRFWRDSGRNKDEEWECFFSPAVLCNHLSSLSTSSVLIRPHPLTQDSLLFWSSIISCNVLNLESPK